MAESNLVLALILEAALFAVAIAGTARRRWWLVVPAVIVAAVIVAAAAVVYEAQARAAPLSCPGKCASSVVGPQVPIPEPEPAHRDLAAQLRQIMSKLEPPPPPPVDPPPGPKIKVTVKNVKQVGRAYHFSLGVLPDREAAITAVDVKFCTYTEAQSKDGCQDGVANKGCRMNYLCSSEPRPPKLRLDQRYATLPPQWQSPRKDVGLEIQIGAYDRTLICKVRAKGDAKDVPSMFAQQSAECL